MKGCMVLTKGWMDWEKLLEEELCWDCWIKDWNVGAICWKAAEAIKSSASRESSSIRQIWVHIRETIPPKAPPKLDWKLCITWLSWLKTLLMTGATVG